MKILAMGRIQAQLILQCVSGVRGFGQSNFWPECKWQNHYGVIMLHSMFNEFDNNKPPLKMIALYR